MLEVLWMSGNKVNEYEFSSNHSTFILHSLPNTNSTTCQTKFIGHNIKITFAGMYFAFMHY